MRSPSFSWSVAAAVLIALVAVVVASAAPDTSAISPLPYTHQLSHIFFEGFGLDTPYSRIPLASSVSASSASSPSSSSAPIDHPALTDPIHRPRANLLFLVEDTSSTDLLNAELSKLAFTFETTDSGSPRSPSSAAVSSKSVETLAAELGSALSGDHGDRKLVLSMASSVGLAAELGGSVHDYRVTVAWRQAESSFGLLPHPANSDILGDLLGDDVNGEASDSRSLSLTQVTDLFSSGISTSSVSVDSIRSQIPDLQGPDFDQDWAQFTSASSSSADHFFLREVAAVLHLTSTLDLAVNTNPSDSDSDSDADSTPLSAFSQVLASRPFFLTVSIRSLRDLRHAYGRHSDRYNFAVSIWQSVLADSINELTSAQLTGRSIAEIVFLPGAIAEDLVSFSTAARNRHRAALQGGKVGQRGLLSTTVDTADDNDDTSPSDTSIAIYQTGIFFMIMLFVVVWVFSRFTMSITETPQYNKDQRLYMAIPTH